MARARSQGRKLLPAALLVLLAGCDADQEAVVDTPDGWRTVTFDRCCQIARPAGFKEIPKPAGVGDQTFFSFGDEAAEITFEYRPQVGFPEGPLGQTGWTTRTLTVDGRSADLVSYDARDAFAGGRTLRLRVSRPNEPTFQSAPTPAKGMELGATGHCRDEASCAIVEQIYQSIDFPPLRR